MWADILALEFLTWKVTNGTTAELFSVILQESIRQLIGKMDCVILELLNN